jgi:hypothetical protein
LFHRSFRIIELRKKSRKIFEFKGLICKIFRNKDLGCQRALKMGFCGSFEGRLGRRHTSNCPNQISIIAHGGLDVCDGGHRWFVMKKVRRRIAEVGSPAASYVSKRATLGAVWRREAKVPLCYQTSGPPFAKSTRRMGHALHGCAGGGRAVI